MSGHSKFANIKHKKEKNDAAKGKVFTIIGREIAVAVKEGGPDPANNSKLAQVIAKAKANNMPNDTIDRGIKKAAGDDGSVNYKYVTYEGYGPNGIAIIVDALTDNQNRTAANVRNAFTKGNGNVGTPGCVSFMFDKKGQIIIDKEEYDGDADELMMLALDAGAEDFAEEEDSFEILTSPDDFDAVLKALQDAGIEMASSEVTMIPQNYVELTDETAVKNLQRTLDLLDEDDDVQTGNKLISGIDENSELRLDNLDKKQHFTQPPAHYTEASLVKTLEELGIGRPSTYAPTITTIIARRYVAKENKNLYVTELGEAVNNIMLKAFPTIVDVNFTATMEALLDSVEEGTVDWKTVIRNFYPDLDESVKAAEKELENVKIEDEVTDVVCDVCGRNMVIKYGPHGKFLACPGFPECRNTKPYLEKIGVACPKCGKEIVMRKTKKGRRYYGCEDNPECDFMSWQKPVAKKCPKCGGYMVEKGSKIACADENCGYVEQKPKYAE